MSMGFNSRVLAAALANRPTLAEVTELYVKAIVAANHGNVSAAARELGVSWRRVHRILDRRTGGVIRDRDLLDVAGGFAP